VNLDGEEEFEEELVDIEDDAESETLDSQEQRSRPIDAEALGSQSERVVDADRMEIDEEGAAQPAVPKKKLKLNYDAYKAMSNLIIMYMRREENRMEDEGSDSEGLKRSQVVDWYLNEIEDDIETEAELLEKKELVEKVIDRLIHHVRAIFIIYKYR